MNLKKIFCHLALGTSMVQAMESNNDTEKIFDVLINETPKKLTKYLNKHPGAVNFRNNFTQRSPLQTAIASPRIHHRKVRILLENNANPDEVLSAYFPDLPFLYYLALADEDPSISRGEQNNCEKKAAILVLHGTDSSVKNLDILKDCNPNFMERVNKRVQKKREREEEVNSEIAAINAFMLEQNKRDKHNVELTATIAELLKVSKELRKTNDQ